MGDTCEDVHCSLLLLLTLKFRMNSRKSSFVRSIRAALEQPGNLWTVHSGKFSGLNHMKSWSCFGSSLNLIPYAGVDDFWRSLPNINLILKLQHLSWNMLIAFPICQSPLTYLVWIHNDTVLIIKASSFQHFKPNVFNSLIFEFWKHSVMEWQH